MSGVLAVLDQHAGTAAWVQAIGAISIIVATALIASRDSRETRRKERLARHQMWESIAVLSRNCLDALDNLLTNYPQHPSSDSYGEFLRSHTPSDFDIPLDGLAAVPLHQVGDAALITAVLRLRGAMGRIKKHLDDVRDAKGVMPLSRELIHSQRTPVFNAVASVLRIVEGNVAAQEISRLAARV